MHDSLVVLVAKMFENQKVIKKFEETLKPGRTQEISKSEQEVKTLNEGDILYGTIFEDGKGGQ